MRRAVIAILGVILGGTSSVDSLEARQPTPPPIIHRVTLLPGDGVLVIEGTGLGDHLLVTVNGQAVTTLPGATATRIDAQAPATVLTTPGTYRLTVADPVRRAWDGFIVASAPVVGAGLVAAAPASGGGRDEVDGRSKAATATQPMSGGASHAPRPLTVIEDSGSPFRTALGASALGSNLTTGLNNTGLGYHALLSNTFGSQNTAVGSQALEANIASDNTAVGRNALGENFLGTSNTAVGNTALRNNTNGLQNTAVGRAALFFNGTGDFNVAVGALAGADATTGDYNIFIGAEVLGTSTDANTIRIGLPFSLGVGQSTTFIAGIQGTTLPGSPDGVYIDAVGRLGSGPVVPASNTVGSAQVIADSLTAADLASGAVGTSELADNAVTAAKVAFNYAGSTAEGGAASDLACTGCVAAGEVSFAFAGLGANVFQGTQLIGTGNLDLDFSSAVEGNITKRGTRFLHNPGAQNTFVGLTAGNFTLSGADNTGTGDSALVNLSTGARNTAVGSDAGVAITFGSDNVYLGANVQGTAGDANTMRLGLPFDGGTGAGQNRTFIAGVAGTVLTTPAVQVFVDANGQLGTLVPAPITGTINGPLSAIPRPDAALVRELAEQRALIAELRARLAAVEALVAARPNRR